METPSSKDMEMEVIDRLAGVGPVVCQHAESASDHALAARDLYCQLQRVRDKHAVFRDNIVKTSDVPSGHDKDMSGSLGRKIAKGYRVLAHGNELRCEVSVSDAAEDTATKGC